MYNEWRIKTKYVSNEEIHVGIVSTKKNNLARLRVILKSSKPAYEFDVERPEIRFESLETFVLAANLAFG